MAASSSTEPPSRKPANLQGSKSTGDFSAINEEAAGGLSEEQAAPLLLAYRSVGLGIYGAVLRFAGMPLEKIAVFANSSAVSGSNQLQQAVQLTFKDGVLAPFRVVGRASLVAWFFQYSVMGFVFQACDTALTLALSSSRVPYGPVLFEPPDRENGRELKPRGPLQQATYLTKTAMTPILAGTIESVVANRAEVQRFYGIEKFSGIEKKLNWNAVARYCGPAFVANTLRNVVMSSTSFVFTPTLYKLYYPQESKSTTSLFWFGLGMNIFAGNVVGITMQALWGRALDDAAKGGGRNIDYGRVVREGLQKEGVAAFFTPAKWFSRVLMNAPAQGTIPWFYNQVLPLFEQPVLNLARPLLKSFSPPPKA